MIKTNFIHHGLEFEQRALVPRSSHLEGSDRFWNMDVLWPRKIAGKADLFSVDEGTAAFLKGLVLSTQPDMVFETGTHKGRSTAAFIEGMDESGRGEIWTVDMHDYGIDTSGAIPEESLHRLSKIVGRTPAVFGEEFFNDMPPINIAFLDGAHDDETLRAEIEFVRGHAAPNCIVLFDNADDYGWPDVKVVIHDIFEDRLVNLPTCTGLSMVQIKKEL